MRTEPLEQGAIGAPEVTTVSLTHCPHCGTENFTMEGWEDLDHCASCGKPLGELDRRSADDRVYATGSRRAGGLGCDGQNREKPRPA